MWATAAWFKYPIRAKMGSTQASHQLSQMCITGGEREVRFQSCQQTNIKTWGLTHHYTLCDLLFFYVYV